MARDLTASMVTGLTSGVIRPVLLGYFDILTDPLTAWTGYGTFAPSGTGDTVLNGKIFVNMAPFIEMTDVVEDQGIGGPVQMTVSGHDLDEELLRQIVRDKREWRGRKAYLWLGLLNSDEATVIADPVRIKTGVMTQMVVKRQKDDASVVVTIDADLGRARGSIWRWIDHPRLFPTDKWSTFIIALSNQPEGITDARLNNDGDPAQGPGTDGQNNDDR